MLEIIDTSPLASVAGLDAVLFRGAISPSGCFPSEIGGLEPLF